MSGVKTLQHFLYKANAMSLYRQFFRSTRMLNDKTSRGEDAGTDEEMQRLLLRLVVTIRCLSSHSGVDGGSEGPV